MKIIKDGSCHGKQKYCLKDENGIFGYSMKKTNLYRRYLETGKSIPPAIRIANSGHIKGKRNYAIKLNKKIIKKSTYLDKLEAIKEDIISQHKANIETTKFGFKLFIPEEDAYVYSDDITDLTNISMMECLNGKI